MRLGLVMFAAVLGMVSTAAPSEAAPLDPNRAAIIDTVISSGSLSPVYERLDKLLAEDSVEPVVLVLNSPGGEVVSGVSLINKVLALRAKGIDVNCYVLDMAASMAFQILTQCTKRYALTNSFLLWHGVRTSTSGPITAMVASSMAEDLGRMDDSILRQLEGSLSLTLKEIAHHFDRETLWNGLQLMQADRSFLSVEDAYPEVLELFNSKKTARTATGGGFFNTVETGSHTIVHSIWRKYEYLLDSPEEPDSKEGKGK